MKILLLEDDPLLAKVLARQLTKRGHDVTHVMSIMEARTRVQESHFDLVLTDQHVIGGDGWSIRQSVNTETTRVVLMTAAPPENPPPFYWKVIDPLSKLFEMIEGTT